MSTLIISGGLIIAPILLLAAIHLWSADSERRRRAWNLLRLLVRYHR